MLLVADVLPIVDAVVAQMSRHLPQHVSTQDLASAGKLALMEILNDFDGSFAQDRGYVICRVRGAVMDEMRRLDPLSRYGRKQVRRVQKAVATLEIKLSRGPTDAEVAVESGLPEAEVRKISQLGIAAEQALRHLGLVGLDLVEREFAVHGASIQRSMASRSSTARLTSPASTA